MPRAHPRSILEWLSLDRGGMPCLTFTATGRPSQPTGRISLRAFLSSLL
jgi:hypothetical protein